MKQHNQGKKPAVYIVHAVDVEGPMTETLHATFGRMYGLGLPDTIKPSLDNLTKIQQGCMDGLNAKLAEKFMLIFNRHSLGYLNDWKQIDSAIAKVISNKFRRKHCSKGGEPYLFSWFIYDHHEGFTNNPRYHDVGTHHIFDHYMDGVLKNSTFNDGVYWHYHHPAPSGDALESGTCWTNNAAHEEIVAKRIIDRQWYFSCFRAGLHIERNDLSHWLEMYIPFDFSARYSNDNTVYTPGSDFDWRGCPDKWGAWHPDWYDYRSEGDMNRYLFRCCDLWTYLSRLQEVDVSEAFEQAEYHGSSVLTYYNHDYRNMKHEIEEGYDIITAVASRFPNVEWKFVNALEAAQMHIGMKKEKPNLSFELNNSKLKVSCNTQIFGPQPFLAINEKGQYFRDNFTDEGNNTWVYEFRNINDIVAFGVAANSPSGNYNLFVKKLKNQ